MDELIIGEKTYLSSKRAAKITGYAKDYVGQLCREGRVEARLVGRNWYVLESSIREHRFGVAGEPEAVVSEVQEVEVPAQEIPAITWSAPRYEVEEPATVPALLPKDPEVLEARKVVSEMQDAWKEWFAAQKNEELLLPSGGEEFGGTLTPALLPAEDTEEEVVSISRISTQAAPEPHYVEEEAEEVLSMHKTYDTRETGEEVPTNYPIMDLSTPIVPVRATRAEQAPTKRGNSNLVAKTALIAVAFISVCVASVGTGLVGDWVGQSGSQSALLKYLGGESEYKSIK